MIRVKNDIRLSKYFTLKEFAHYEDGYVIDVADDFFKFVNALQLFRKWYNRPIIITSGYRPPLYNKAVGGSVNSSHLKALAIDFKLPQTFNQMDKLEQERFLNNVKSEWTDICKCYGKGAQCNYYDTYIHIGFSLNSENSYIDKRKK